MMFNQLAATQSLVEVIEGRAQTLSESFFWTFLTKEAMSFYLANYKKPFHEQKVADLTQHIHVRTEEAYGEWALVSCSGMKRVKKGSSKFVLNDYPICWVNSRLKSVIYRRDSKSLAYYLIHEVLGLPRELNKQTEPFLLLQSPPLKGYYVDETYKNLAIEISDTIQAAEPFNLQSRREVQTQREQREQEKKPSVPPLIAGKGHQVYMYARWKKTPKGVFISGLSAIATNPKGEIVDEFEQTCVPKLVVDGIRPVSSEGLEQEATMQEILTQFCEWAKPHRDKNFYIRSSQAKLRQWFEFYRLQAPVIQDLYPLVKKKWPQDSQVYFKQNPRIEIILRCYGVLPYQHGEPQLQAKKLQQLHRCLFSNLKPIYTPHKVLELVRLSFNINPLPGIRYRA